jgi:hypothetical protein
MAQSSAGVEEVNMNGVTVYPHVTGGKWCADCNLPADICRGHDDNTMCAPAVDVAALAAQIAALPAQTLTELAAAIAAIDAPVAERFGDALLDAVYDATVVEFGPPFMVAPPSERSDGVYQAQSAAINADLRKWAAMDDDDDVGYEYALASAQ